MNKKIGLNLLYFVVLALFLSLSLWQWHRADEKREFLKQQEHAQQQETLQLSNIVEHNAEMLRYAIKVGGRPSEGGIVSVQNEYSPNYHHWAEVIDICTENKIAFLPWSPLGGGNNFKRLGSGEIGSFKNLADQKGVSPYALTIAWHLAKFPTSIPIPGASKSASILDSVEGTRLSLSREEIEELDRSCPTDTPINSELLDIARFEK